MNKNKLRTAEQLSDFLQQELAWRKKELTVLIKLLDTSNKTPVYRDSLLRAGVTVLYAHWEGCIKTCATAYVCFVAMQRLTYRELSPNFLTLSVKHKIHAAIESSAYIMHRQLTDFFLLGLDERSHISWETAIETQANLSSGVFKNIVELIGLEYLSQYETKQNVIDEQLLKNRNHAAHGDGYLEIDEALLLELYRIFIGDKNNLGLLDLFANQIINAALQRKYM